MATNLIDYGIHTEDSDLRVHVCYVVKRIYLYPTGCGLDAIATGNYEKRPAYQNVNGEQVLTAMGYIIPYHEIDRCKQIALPDDAWKQYHVDPKDSTSLKGKRAAQLIAAAINYGYIPIPMKCEVIEDSIMQREGIDVIAKGVAKIQVKCDYKGGDRAYGGTGNLYLQIAEINPLQQH